MGIDTVAMKITGHTVLVWDVVDVKTRFLMSTHMLPASGMADPGMILAETADICDRIPNLILANDVLPCADHVEFVFGSETQRVSVNQLKAKRCYRMPDTRTRVMRGLRSLDMAILFSNGWTSFYTVDRQLKWDTKRDKEIGQGEG
ncbi:MAG: hypothetical protein PHV74_06980 [Dehalococcoidia bacterium]|nr:hypothetical protein [Dehalococcoidia bacterium]